MTQSSEPKRETRRLRRPVGRGAWVGALSLVVLLAALVGAFLIKADTLLAGFDGGYMRELARRQDAWGMSWAYIGPDHLMGLGDLFFTTNFQLFPSYLVGALFGAGDLSKAVLYTVTFAELAGSVYLLGRRLQLNPAFAWLAGLVLPLLSLPLFEAAALYPIYAVVPQMATTVAVTTLMAWAYLGIGRESVAVPAAIFIGGLLYLVFSAIVVLTLAMPIMLFYSIAGLVGAKSPRERWLKAVTLVLGMVLMFAGPFWFLLGLVTNTAPAFFAAELFNDRATLLFSTMLFHGALITLAGPGLALLAIAGAALVLFGRDAQSSLRRALAISILAFLILLISLWSATLLGDFWPGPSPLYFELYAAPLYAVFAALALSQILTFGMRLLRTERLKVPARLRPIQIAALSAWRCGSALGPRAGMTVAAGALALSFAAFTKTPFHPFAYPPTPTPLTQALAEDLALFPETEFRGRVANLTGQHISGSANWLDLYQRDIQVNLAFGNGHRMVGLTHFGIPTLFQYTPSISPGIYAITSRLLTRAGDQQMRSTLPIRRHNPRILAMLGVAAVITDAPLKDGPQIAKAIATDLDLRAYSVADPNLGAYAPSRVVSGLQGATILSAMASPDFDPRALAYADLSPDRLGRDLSGGFAPVTDARLTITRQGWHVTAESTGQGFLLLPFEFSACLSLSASKGAPHLFRTNLVLTGVLFEGPLDMSVTLSHGPFTRSRCRLKDRAAFRSLKLGAASVLLSAEP